MPHATVTADFDEPFDIKGRLPAQVALYLDVMVNILTKLGNIVFAQVLDPDIRVYACGFDDVAGIFRNPGASVCHQYLWNQYHCGPYRGKENYRVFHAAF